MATQPISEGSGRSITLEEYLSTGYEPDCEFDDGVVVERNVGEFEHSFLQTLLATIFTNNMDDWNVFGLTEQRIQIAPQKCRIPDVCVLRVGSRADDVLVEPPLAIIEIMSPEDTIRRTAQKAAEYCQFGIEHVWVIEPSARVAYRGTPAGLERIVAGELTISGTPIMVLLSDLFAKLDHIRTLGGR
jgi:Uma2 family endonuclease